MAAELDIWKASLLGRADELLRAVERLHSELNTITTIEELTNKKRQLGILVESKKVRFDLFQFLNLSDGHHFFLPDARELFSCSSRLCSRGYQNARS